MPALKTVYRDPAEPFRLIHQPVSYALPDAFVLVSPGAKAAVITGKTPEKFAGLCETSLQHIDRRANMAIIEAWNEWGEGSFIEPDKEWGFAFLDAVRETFTDAPAEHVDTMPPPDKIASFSILNDEEVARARAVEGEPYPDPPLSPRTVEWRIDEPLPESDPLQAWEFAGNSSEGWGPYHVEPFVVRDGILSTTVNMDDPQLIVDNVGVAIESLRCIALKLKVSEDVSSCQLFWTTTGEPRMSADKTFTFPINPDGDWHTYQVSKKPEGNWSGVLKHLRLDIGGPGHTIDADWVRLYGKAP